MQPLLIKFANTRLLSNKNQHSPSNPNYQPIGCELTSSQRPISHRPINQRPINQRPINQRPVDQRPANQQPDQNKPSREQTEQPRSSQQQAGKKTGEHPAAYRAAYPDNPPRNIPPNRQKNAPTKTKRPILTVPVTRSAATQWLNAAAAVIGAMALAYAAVHTDVPWPLTALLFVPLCLATLATHRDQQTAWRLTVYPDDTVGLTSPVTVHNSHPASNAQRYQLTRSFHCHAFVMLVLRPIPEPFQTPVSSRSVITVIIARDATDTFCYRALRRWLHLFSYSVNITSNQ